MNNQSVLEIVIKAKDEATAQLKGIQGSLKNMEGSLKSVRLVSLGAFGAITGTILKTVDGYKDAEVQLAKFTAVMQQAGDASGEVAKAFQDQAQASIKMGYDDEESANSLAKLYQATKSQTEATRINAIAMDFARLKNISLSEATDVMTKVMGGSGAKALKDFGIQVDKGTTSMEMLAIIQEKSRGQATAYAATIQGQSDRVRETLSNLSDSIGQSLAPVITNLLNKLTPVLDKFADWASKNGELLAKILLVGAGISGFLVVLTTIGLVVGPVITAFSAIGTVIGFLSGIVPILSGVLTGLGAVLTFLAANPIVLIVAAIVALVAGIVWMIYNWDLVKQKVNEVFDFILPYITEYTKVILDVVKKWITAIKDFVTNGFTSLKESVLGVWQSIKDTIFGIIDSITSKIQSMVDAIQSAYSKATSYFGGSTSVVVGSLQAAGKKAQGGSVSGGSSYLVGENGPEIFSPSSAGRITPNNAFGSSGGNTVINITGTFLSEDSAQRVGDMLIQRLQLNSRIGI